MTRRNPYDYEDDERGSYLALVALIGIVFTFFLALAIIPFVAAKVGAESRPGYAGLTADQVPDITHIQFNGDGTATVAGTNPGAGVWMAATFHIPNLDQWHDGQTLTDTIGVPAGTFNVTLRCEPGAGQVDVWLVGQLEVYAAAITLDCGTVAVQAPDGSPPVEPHSANGGAEGPDRRPLVLSPAGQNVSAVASAATDGTSSGEARHLAVAPTLPATGVGVLVLFACGVLLILAGTGCVGLTHKGRRS